MQAATALSRYFRPTFWRGLAAAMASIVLCLSLASVSPEAHAWLHEDGPADGSASAPHHVCAVELFAGGVALTTAAFMPLPAIAVAPFQAADYARLFLSTPRYLLQPERGPPAV